jgi:hypothetical protein
MLELNDEVLMAWVDGELDAEAASRVAAALARDPQAELRVAALQRLSEQLRTTFAHDLSDAVPASLSRTAHGEHLRSAGSTAQILPLPWLRSPWARWGGMAAGVMLALGLGIQGLSGGWGEPPLVAKADGGLWAGGALAVALERHLAGDGVVDGVRVQLSFQDRLGRYCRSFDSPAGAGLACREGGRWQVAVLAATGAHGGEGLRLAGSAVPAAVIEAVEQRIAGLALGAHDERAARDRGWTP